jgi:F-type H+-transporting ATPase subunit b
MLGYASIVAAAEKTKNPLIPAWNELIWGTVAFVLLLVVLWRAGVFKRISEALAERTAKIEGQIKDAEATQAEANKILEDYKRQVAGAREEANRIVAEAREAGEQLRKDLQQKAQEEANRMVESARLEIQAERERAKRELRREVGSLAVQVAERVVGSELDHDRQLSLVDSYIDELSASGASGAAGASGNGGAAS